MTDLDDDARRIGEIAARLAELRTQRVLAASRLASELEACVRPIRDKQLLKLIDLVQGQLARILADRPEADG